MQEKNLNTNSNKISFVSKGKTKNKKKKKKVHLKCRASYFGKSSERGTYVTECCEISEGDEKDASSFK